MGIVPIWGFQMITAAFLAHFMKLNKVLVLVAANISLPPLIPFIVYFSYKVGGLVLNTENELSRETLLQLRNQIADGQFYATFQDLGYSIYQYIIGSFALGAALGLIVGVVTYLIITISTRLRKN